jgi:hypothetical protein
MNADTGAGGSNEAGIDPKVDIAFKRLFALLARLRKQLLPNGA